jgi:hypothetical protein
MKGIRGMKMLDNKKGQVTIYIIIALVLIGGIIIYFALRERMAVSEIVPEEFSGIYQAYDSCLMERTREAINFAESGGGRVYPGDYVPGSDYAPFGNQLNFLGFGVPYWYYVSGNGLIKENVPSKTDMQNDIAKYIEERINDCNLDAFYQQGFYINFGEPTAKVIISDSDVSVSLTSDISSSREAASARKTSYSVSVASKLGALYNDALGIYNYEKQSAFLENYSVDVMRNYAPVDGVEISCSGKIWRTREVADDLKNALSANIGAIKFNGNYYTLNSAEEKYFVVDKSVNEPVSLIYLTSWPSRVEIYGADNELMIASPVGAQEGMGAMGFCYAPYHFVYDIYYPVLMQLTSGEEIFQFPLTVVVDKNVPRNALYSEIPWEQADFDLCAQMTQDVSVSTYDINLNKIDANITYECFNQKCRLGQSENGEFNGKAPACVNGYIYANAEGYTENKVLFSSNEETSADVILEKAREVNVKLKVGGEDWKGSAIISFYGDKSASTALPGDGKMTLSEGLYNTTVYVYDSTSLTIPSSTKTQCTTIPKSGILGFFGGTTQQCFPITIPETKIESALAGGGKSEIYVFDSDLEKGTITLSVDKLPKPTTLEQLQANYALFDTMNVGFESG